MTNLNKVYKELKNIIKNSYAPYSKFPTAALVETDKGFFKGVNVENASYPAGLCAERVAIYTAITNGAKSFKALYCLTSSSREDITSCGQCLQVMSEFFKPTTLVYFFNNKGKMKKYTFKQLMPNIFTTKQLRSKGSK